MRLGIGGFGIESSTFSPLVSRAADFRVLRGDSLLATYSDLPCADDVEIVPLVRANAIPGGPVERAFYEEIKAEFLTLLHRRAPLDGVLLHMHGAASVVGLADAEGDWISSVRDAVGDSVVLVASYDLHGNVSRSVFDGLDVLTACRTAPHTDVTETLARARRILADRVRRGHPPCGAFVPVPVLLPGERTSTEWSPGDGLYGMIPRVVEEERLVDASVLIGYVWADERRATGSVVAYADAPEKARRGATRLAERFWAARTRFEFGVRAGPTDDCIRAALESPVRPVVISDSGDNPTAGGAGDVPYVLARLLALDVPDAVLASMADAAAADVCFAAGEGATVRLSLGGKLDPRHGPPLAVEGRVLTLATRPWTLAAEVPNRIAVVRVAGVRVIVTERRTPFHHLEDFRALGIEPARHAIVVVKIGYLVPDLKALAARSLLALSPGAVDQDVTRLPYQRISRPMYPFDPDMIREAPLRPVLRG